jgi:curved DNA-binding protein
MDFKDYYAILGVPPNADKKVIQQTYRQLARKYHPDLNPGNKEAEEKFKTINEAYQVLSNAEQRKKYDELRGQYQQWQQTGSQKQDFNWQNWSAQPGNGAHVQYASPEDLEDLFGSDSPYSDFFTSIFGQAPRGSKGGARKTPPNPRRGRDMEYEVELTLEDAFHGAKRLMEIDGRRIQVSIPAGVRTGTRVRLAGRGEPGLNGGTAGDLYLIPHVLPNDTFERAGDDLLIDVPVDIFTAIAGGEIRIPSMAKPLLLTIPPRTNSNRSFRLRGKGMPHLGDPRKHGDMFARVRLVLPDPLSDEEVDHIRELLSRRHDSSKASSSE